VQARRLVASFDTSTRFVALVGP